MITKRQFYQGNKDLLRLADFLDTLPSKRFDFNTWVGDDWKGKPDLSCGTTACALGWAATIPAFRKRGLRLTMRGGYADVLYENYTWSLNSGAAFFNLSLKEARHLFTNDGMYNGLNLDPSAKQVAHHIRKFVAKRKEETNEG